MFLVPWRFQQSGYTALHLASAEGHLEVVKHLVSGWSNIEAENEFFHTPLYCASLDGHLSVVQFLLASGADMEAIDVRRSGGGASAFTEKLQTLAQYQAQQAETRHERQERAAIEEKRWTENHNIRAETLVEAKRAAQAQEGLHREELEERKAARVAKDARDDKALDLQIKTMDNMMVMEAGMQTMFNKVFEKFDE
eukprot:jgi/Mesvir1/7382/Mv19183-RA.1